MIEVVVKRGRIASLVGVNEAGRELPLSRLRDDVTSSDILADKRDWEDFLNGR